MPIDTSASSAFLSGKWEVEIHPLGRQITLEAPSPSTAAFPLKCGSGCTYAGLAATDRLFGLPSVPITVSYVYLWGSFDGGEFSISMKEMQLFGGLRLNESLSPLLTDSGTPNFWLEGLMTVKLLLNGSDRPLSLVSRNAVLQTGRALSWPPYNTVMSDRSGPNQYVVENGNPDEPILTLWSGSITIEAGPVDFLEVTVPVSHFQVNPVGQRGLLLEWEDIRKEMPVVQSYNVYRCLADGGLNRGQPELLARGLDVPRFVDTGYDGQQLFSYQIRPVHTDKFGTELVLGANKWLYYSPTQPFHGEQLISTGYSL
jgi:hypothetical protein